MAQARVRSADQGVRAADAALTAATLNRDRQASLVRDGLTSTRNMELAELAFVRARTDVDRAQAALSAARSEESALDGDRLRVGTDLDASINDGLASRAAAVCASPRPCSGGLVRSDLESEPPDGRLRFGASRFPCSSW
jgi:hypothetical protein